MRFYCLAWNRVMTGGIQLAADVNSKCGSISNMRTFEHLQTTEYD